jgi:hypothetical protein
MHFACHSTSLVHGIYNDDQICGKKLVLTV